MRELSLCALTLLALVAVVGCYEDPFEDPDELIDTEPVDLSTAELFATAAEQAGVPADLLLAMAWHSSSYAPVDVEEQESRPGHGVMGLSDAHVAAIEELTGTHPATIQGSREANVLGAARLLASLRDQHSPDAPADMVDVAWWPVLVAWPGFGEDWLDHDYARDVFWTLQSGLATITPEGEAVELTARRIDGLEDVDYVPPPMGDDGARDVIGFPDRARFVPAHSSNQSSRTAGTSSIQRVVLHTTEGSYAGAISWFTNSSSNVSSHYVLRRSDGEITQMVSDEGKAWHACNNNNDTIGLEHEGASGSPATWTPAMLDSSARLTAWLTVQYDIPIDRDHIVGHGEIQPPECSGRTDPAPYFPWDDYMSLVAEYAGQEQPGDDDDATDPPGDDDDDASGWGPLAFLAPLDGGQAVNPVQVSIQHPENHVELWQGPALLVPYLFGHPAVYEVDFWSLGDKTLTARAYRASGAFVAAKTITFEAVEDVGDDDDASGDDDDATDPPIDTTIHDVDEEELGGATLRFTTTAGSGVSFIEYRVDGWLLTDENTSLQYGVPPDFDLTYTFGYTGERSLEVRAYDAANNLTDTLSKQIVVPEIDLPDDPDCTSSYECADSFPYDTSGDTSASSLSVWDYYSCAPSTNESGPEIIYEVVLDEDGFLGAQITDGSGVDVDVHILSDLDPNDCIDRGHEEAGAFLTAGTWYVVVDSWVSASGVVYDGAYTLTLGHTAVDDFVAYGLDATVLEDALTAFDNAWAEDETNDLVYTVIDFSMSSTLERLWTIDLVDSALLWNLHVSHGEASGHPTQLDLATTFSNISGSHQSSLGLARTAETYSGSNGYSLRIDGLDTGYNDLVRPRAIVVHGATYARPEFAASNGYLGRSWGCPAIDDRLSTALIDDIKLGSLMFSWYPDGDWSVNSEWLD